MRGAKRGRPVRRPRVRRLVSLSVVSLGSHLASQPRPPSPPPAQIGREHISNLSLAYSIQYGTKRTGRFSEETIAKLVRLYQDHGLVFLPGEPTAGIRYGVSCC